MDKCPDGDDLMDQNKNGMPYDCEGRIDPVYSECAPDAKGNITICWIPHDPSKMRAVKESCEWLSNFFKEDGRLRGDSKCGPCLCSYKGEKDSDVTEYVMMKMNVQTTMGMIVNMMITQLYAMINVSQMETVNMSGLIR